MFVRSESTKHEAEIGSCIIEHYHAAEAKQAHEQ